LSRGSNEQATPPALPGKFNVAIAHLEGDDDHAKERVIRDSLRDRFPIIHAMPFDRLISSEDERKGHERARALLKASGFDVMIWGDYLPEPEKAGKSRFRLHLTVSRDARQTSSPARYQTTNDLNLPPLFWQDLTYVLGLVVANSEAEFTAHEGQFQANKLAPFIDRVRALLQSSQSEQGNAATRAEVQSTLGHALVTYGEQSARNGPLQEAVAVYGEALKELTREKVPFDWAATQNNLGNALLILGARESGPARLTQAVNAYREALKERTREKVPLAVWRQLDFPVASIKSAALYAATAVLAEADFDRFAAVAR
jgi:tetratricopeptide (TPR) repeat protein